MERPVRAQEDGSAKGSAKEASLRPQYIVFNAGEAVFAVGLSRVQEIIEPEVWVRVPHAAAWVEGLLYHHGEALLVLNGGSLLNGLCTPREASATVIRMNDPSMKVGILVNKILGTWRPTVPATPSKGAFFVNRVWEHKGRLVNHLEVEALLERAARVFEA
jgi:chemotaxis signal transduction protein